jgi:hypothetical protein
MMSTEVGMKKLMQACEKDPELLNKLLEKPQEIAKQYDAALGPEELQQLQRVKKLRDLVEEFKAGRVIPHPVGYPIDVLWKTTLANHILSYRPIFYPIFYTWGPISYRWRPISYRGGPISYFGATPIGYPYSPVQFEASRQLSGLRSVSRKK